MELLDLKRFCYLNDNLEYEFIDCSNEITSCGYVYSLSLWSCLHKWCCGYVNLEDESRPIFVGFGETYADAINECWNKIMKNEDYEKK